jgi:hypothetical protein
MPGSLSGERPVSGFLDIPSCRLAPVFEVRSRMISSTKTYYGHSRARDQCRY